MATPPTLVISGSSSPTKIGSVKCLVESKTLTSLPSSYVYTTTREDDAVAVEDHQIPTIDFSLLTNACSVEQRSQAVRDLGNACRDWGFFLVINHGVPEKLIERMFDECKSFFDLTEEEKQEFAGEHVLDPIRCGTSFNASVEKPFFWRDFLKVFVHPQFHSPHKPSGFRDISFEYCKRVREVARELLKAVSESLGLEGCYIEKEMELEHGLQILAANLYPPCPQPELAIGLPPHSDHGLLTLLVQNQGGGLQVHHCGKWVQVNAPPNSFLVNTADHIEILSNGKYKSVVHQAVVNNKVTRISVAMPHGPSLDKVVAPAPDLLQNEEHQAMYRSMKYKDYLELQQSNKLDGKSCLDRLRI